MSIEVLETVLKESMELELEAAKLSKELGMSVDFIVDSARKRKGRLEVALKTLEFMAKLIQETDDDNTD